jgi:hypothetical protein
MTGGGIERTMTDSILVTAAGGAGSAFLGDLVEQAVPTRVASKVETIDQTVSSKNTEPDCEAMLLRAWQMAEKRYGPDDLAVGSALANLAEYYQSRGQTVEAEECDRRIRFILNKFLASVA